jgi:hypothetical protein
MQAGCLEQAVAGMLHVGWRCKSDTRQGGQRYEIGGSGWDALAPSQIDALVGTELFSNNFQKDFIRRVRMLFTKNGMQHIVGPPGPMVTSS